MAAKKTKENKISPKGFIELRGASDGERLLIRVSDINLICEVTENSKIKPSFLLPEEKNGKTVIFSKPRTFCVLDTYEDVCEKIRVALVPQAVIDKDGSLTVYPEV